jgi:hypothetical protein
MMGMQLLQRVSNDSLAAIILPEPQKLPPRSFIWPLISLNAFFYRSMDGNGVVTGPSLLEAGDSEYVALTRLGIKPKVNLSLISISARSRPGKGLTGFGIDQIALWNECFRSDVNLEWLFEIFGSFNIVVFKIIDQIEFNKIGIARTS